MAVIRQVCSRWRYTGCSGFMSLEPSMAKIASRFHDWVIERMIMSSTEIRTAEGEL